MDGKKRNARTMTDVSGSLPHEEVLVDEIVGCEGEEYQDELAD